jgi:hypothetical protein
LHLSHLRPQLNKTTKGAISKERTSPKSRAVLCPQCIRSEMSIFQCLKNSMKKNPNTENSDWNISFWFAVLSPLIGVALGFAAAAVIEAL